MENEREKSREQNEGSGQQQPLGQQDEQVTGQAGQQPQGQQSQQQFGQQHGQQPAGKQDSDTQTLSQSGNDVGPGGYSAESGASDLGGGETGLGDSGGDGSFVGSQRQESGEYLQQSGNPESGFAEQGRGASNQNEDIERETERSQNRESDIEGSSDNG